LLPDVDVELLIPPLEVPPAPTEMESEVDGVTEYEVATATSPAPPPPPNAYEPPAPPPAIIKRSVVVTPAGMVSALEPVAVKAT
jgi:hypothetical protein